MDILSKIKSRKKQIEKIRLKDQTIHIVGIHDIDEINELIVCISTETLNRIQKVQNDGNKVAEIMNDNSIYFSIPINDIEDIL